MYLRMFYDTLTSARIPIAFNPLSGNQGSIHGTSLAQGHAHTKVIPLIQASLSQDLLLIVDTKHHLWHVSVRSVFQLSHLLCDKLSPRPHPYHAS